MKEQAGTEAPPASFLKACFLVTYTESPACIEKGGVVMNLDIKEIPFSRFGSYFCISMEKDTNEVYIRDVHGGDDAPSRLFKVAIHKDGIERAFVTTATETAVKFHLDEDPDSYAEVILPEEDELHIHVQGVELSLQPVKKKYDSFMEIADGMYEYHIYSKELKLMLIRLEGEMDIEAPWDVIDNHFVHILLKDGHFVIASYRTVYREKEYCQFAEGKAAVEAAYAKWLREIGNGHHEGQYAPSVERASYITWSSVVHPAGLLPDYAMYMSKLWMYNIWSWDNCFNALNLGEKYPELAYRQLEVFIDAQDESGAYPDFINDKFVSYNCIKPPIFLYAYEKLMEMNDYFKDEKRLRKVYNSSKKVISYFEEYRTYEGRLPHYKHGNDSGWDNASLFHEGMPVEAPDLASFLIRACDILAKFAPLLGEEADARLYKQKADHLFSLLMERLHDEVGFFGRHGQAAEKIPIRSSLILRLPVLIGYRLDKEIMDKLIADLEANFETRFGFATECPESPYYKENGYWLGPIWAPVTYLFIDAMAESGYVEAANRISDKFLDLTLSGGMAENFDPFTGKGLVDTSFTWTSSVFLLLLKNRAVLKS